jgi:hypothetical protein
MILEPLIQRVRDRTAHAPNPRVYAARRGPQEIAPDQLISLLQNLPLLDTQLRATMSPNGYQYFGSVHLKQC